MGSQVLTVRVTGRCSRSQHRRLGRVCAMSAELYNACPGTWRGTYAWWREHHPKHPDPDKDPKFPAGRRQSKTDLEAQFTRVRKDRPEWGRMHSRVGRGVIRRFDRTRQAFYQRCTAGDRPGYPRFKTAARWRTIEIPDAKPGMLVAPEERGNGSGKWWRLQVKGLPRIRFEDRGGRIRAALTDGKLVELRVVRTALRVELHAVFRLPAPPEPDYEPTRPVGIDKGLVTRLALCDGTLIPAREPDRSGIRRKQRALSRAKKGSTSRVKKRTAVAKAWARETERARQTDHRVAHQLVGTYDGIATENLTWPECSAPGCSPGRCQTNDGPPSIRYWNTKPKKLVSNMRRLILPTPAPTAPTAEGANTSTDCSACGRRQPMPMGVRVFRCEACGLVLDRDVNAACNVCARAGWHRGREGQTRRSARNKLLSEDAPTPSREGTQTDATEQYA